MKRRSGEYRYRCTLSLTSAVVGGEWVTLPSPPTTLLPGMTRYHRIGGWVSNMAGIGKISFLPGFDHRAVQLAASRYTD